MRRDWDKIEKAKQWKDEAELGEKTEIKKGKQKETQGRVGIGKIPLSRLLIRSMIPGAYPASKNQLEAPWRLGHLKVKEQRAALKY